MYIEPDPPGYDPGKPNGILMTIFGFIFIAFIIVMLWAFTKNKQPTPLNPATTQSTPQQS